MISLKGYFQDDNSQSSRPQRLLKLAVILVLLVAVCLEGYYIFVLRDKMETQAEEIKNISIQLQLLKQEKENLSEELSSAKKSAGENTNGNTTERQHSGQ